METFRTAGSVQNIASNDSLNIRAKKGLKKDVKQPNWSLLIAALIFSAGYYSSPIFFFLLRRIKKCFALPHFAAFSTFCVKSF